MDDINTQRAPFYGKMVKKTLLGLFFGLIVLITAPVQAQDAVLARRALFVSLIQDPPVLTSYDEIKKLIEFSKAAKVQLLFVQIYRSGQAWFPSGIADASPYLGALKAVKEDPLRLLIHEAHENGIKVHAWLNMLSLGANENAPVLRKYGPEILTKDLEPKQDLASYKIDGQYFLEPSDPRVRSALLLMVQEILNAYPELDGIQFDYLRYPDTHPVYGRTQSNEEAFRRVSGTVEIKDEMPAWQDWKRAKVTEFLRMLVWKVRSIRPGMQVSATGCMSYARAYYEAFQDWPSWINQGLVDFVTAMNYSPVPLEYERRNAIAKSKVLDPQKIFLAVGAYKMTAKPEIFAQEYASCEKMRIGACAIFHYGNFLENPTLAEPFLNKGVSLNSLPGFSLNAFPLATVQFNSKGRSSISDNSLSSSD